MYVYWTPEGKQLRPFNTSFDCPVKLTHAKRQVLKGAMAILDKYPNVPRVELTNGAWITRK